MPAATEPTWVPDHEPNTWAEPRSGGMVWWSCCPCGWRSEDQLDEYGADMAGLDHDDGSGHEVNAAPT